MRDRLSHFEGKVSHLQLPRFLQSACGCVLIRVGVSLVQDDRGADG